MFSLIDCWNRGKEFLGTSYSIMGGAMSWISEHRLVSSISNAGAFGVLACSAMSPDQLEREISLTKELVGSNPFGVNIVLMHPQLPGLIDVCIHSGVTHVILAGGIPSKQILSLVLNHGIKVIAFAPSLSIAKKMCRIGASALIIEGREAGGHITRVSTSVLAQEILPEIRDIPIFVAGGIGTGAIVKSYLEMGAAGCQVGTLFACAKESIAHPRFKAKCVAASSHDAVVSEQLDPRLAVIPVRLLKNDATEEFKVFQREIIRQLDSGHISKEEAQLAIEKFWAGSLRRAVIEGDTERGSVMAGEVVGLVKGERPVRDILDDLISYV
ncbi:NAD(P)H-dependent flavin oxidoreductase [Neorickettsia findlayensis]|uniref:2-nitropropane dioxygenase n=1 Tax=Neorickettsia findlayensis TaxID=2686014 RepID=A0A6P1GAB8_9RICK|nr:nitronate monooxygenase family protein [Neorickettsia findlayensis]QHD65258.1 2-nitropropane dioxygenase [Neorickettsia findlayensis]